MKPAPENLHGLTDEGLAAYRDELAQERTAVRLAQVAVADELQLRAALKGLPAELVQRITIGGAVGSQGGKN
jgi:hypothetical protein